MPIESLAGKKQKKLDPDMLVKHCVEADENVWDSIAVWRSRWDEAWATYNNQFDYSDKADWQSKNHLPKFKMAVRVMRSQLKQALIKASEWFSWTGLNEESKSVEKDIEETLRRIFEQSEYRNEAFGTSIFLGLLENLMILKIYPKELDATDLPISEDQQFKIVIQPVSAYDFRIDTTGRNRFFIHRVKMDLSDYRKLVEQGVYRKETLAEIQSDFEKEDQSYQEKVRQGVVDIPKPSWRKEVELLEYWGDVDDASGERLLENTTFTVANRKHLARAPIPNPFRHGKPPFIWGPIIEKPGAVYAEGFGDGCIGLARMMNETLNIILDANLTGSIKAFEVDLNLLHNPSEAKGGVYPGKTFKVRGVPPGSQAIRDFNLGSFDPASLQILQFEDREFQNATGVNEFISGAVGVGSKTATEVKHKSMASIGFTKTVGEEIEENIHEPMIDMVYSLILQYNPELFGPRVNALPADVLKFDFSAKGMSKILEQADELQQLFMWVGMVAKTPVGQNINWTEIGKMSARMVGQDPSKVLLSEQAKPATPGVETPPNVAAQGQMDQNAAKEQLGQLLQMQGGAR